MDIAPAPTDHGGTGISPQTESRYVRKILAMGATASLLALSLTACGGASGDSLDSISVKPGKDEKTAPEVKFNAPLLTDKSEAVTLESGDGAEIDPGSSISIKSGIYKAIDGTLTNENFTGDATSMTVDDTMKQSMPEFYNLLVDSKVGDWIAYTTVEGTPQADGSVAEPAEGAKAERIIIIHVEGATAPSKDLSKDEIKKLKDEKKLPTVDTSGDTPKISIPKDTDAPSGLVVDVLEEGKGKEATNTSKVTANYTGVRWEDGKVFDSSFERGKATEFSLDGVIKGWTEGLSGLKEGSKVLLSIPADKAYGDGANGQPAGPLVFYVELDKVK